MADLLTNMGGQVSDINISFSDSISTNPGTLQGTFTGVTFTANGGAFHEHFEDCTGGGRFCNSADQNGTYTILAAVHTPEPASMTLLGAGLAVVTTVRRQSLRSRS